MCRDALSPDGWLSTGDVGYVDDEFLFLVDRKKDVIIRGGYNVYPLEVDVVLVDTLPKGPTGKILKRAIDVDALLGERSST